MIDSMEIYTRVDETERGERNKEERLRKKETENKHELCTMCVKWKVRKRVLGREGKSDRESKKVKKGNERVRERGVNK